MKFRSHLLVLALLLIGSNFAISQVAFAPLTTYANTLLSYPRAVTAADVNSDGWQDLIIADAKANRVFILTNYGNGIFWNGRSIRDFPPQSIVSVGAYPTAIVATDINNDGKVDFICTDENANTLTVVTNKGNGTFAVSQTLSTGFGPTWVIAADINHDHAPDLISANWAILPSLSVFTNDGSGVFSSNATYYISGADSVAAADMNGDNNVDLVAAGMFSNVTVLTNNGSGFFDIHGTYTVGNYPRSVQLVDVNGDKKLDVATVDANRNTLSVWTNDGSGILESNVTCSVGSHPYWVVSADVNGNGMPDLICANGDGTLSVLTNDDHVNFALAAQPAVGTATEAALAVSDLNNDGHVDLISINNNANQAGGGLSVLIGVPVLKSSLSNSGMVFSWPSSWTNWTLLQNSDLTTTNWSICGSVFDDGTNKQTTVTSSPPGNLFFRLNHP